MLEKDTRDIVAGAILVALGAFVIGYAIIQLNLGTFRRMGPGMFPMIVGCCISTLGIGIAVPALRRAPEMEMTIDLRSALFVLGAILGFALAIPRFGLIPSIIILTIVSSFADGKLSIINVLLLSAALSLIAYAIFVFALSIQVDILSWPW